MPYDNAYNRGIAEDLSQINKRFAVLYAYSPVDGQGGSIGGSNAGVLYQIGNASKRDAYDNIINNNMDLPPVYYYGQDAEAMEGGSAFAEGTFRDTGFGEVLGAGLSGGDAIDMLMKRGMTKAEAEKYATDQGYYDTASERAQRTSEAKAKADADAEATKAPTFWQGVGDMLQTVAEPVAELAIHALGAGAKKKAGRPKKMKGGSILGNPDPYPRKVDSVRLAGRGKGKKLESPNGALLAMPDTVLANGVPPSSQLRGAYGGSKKGDSLDALQKEVEKAMDEGAKAHQQRMAAKARAERKKVEDPRDKQEVLDALVEAQLGVIKRKKEKGQVSGAVKAKQGKGKNLSGMTDRRVGGKKKEQTHSNDLVHIDVEAPNKIGCGKRKARAELVKKIMKEKGMKMIEASAYIKKEGLKY